MKARVKATEDIVNASYWNTSANGIKYYDIDNSGYTMTEDELDFDFSYTPDYWTRLEHQYAGMAMQGLCANYNDFTKVNDGTCTNVEMICENARIIARALVEKMKENEKAMH